MNRPTILTLTSLAIGAGLWLVVAVWGWWPLGALAVLALDAPWQTRGRGEWPWLRLVAGLAAVIALDTYPVAAIYRLPIAAVYAGLRWWLAAEERPTLQGWAVQVLAYEAIFVWMAVAGLSRTWVAVLVWAVTFVTTREAIGQVAGETATTLAAAWALVAAEIGWVLSAWLVTYVLFGISLLIPQPALVLAAIGYCFGNIFLAQRQRQLSRWRFAELIAVGVIVIAIVVIGTNWRGTV